MDSYTQNSSVMDRVHYYEQRSTPTGRHSLAQPQAVRPGSAGRLLAMDADFTQFPMAQQPPAASSLHPRAPHTPQNHSRFGRIGVPQDLEGELTGTEISNRPQSIHRKGAPQSLRITTADSFAPFPQNSPYAPTAGLVNSFAANIAQFNAIPHSASRASFIDLDSPSVRTITPPSRTRHVRNESQASIASVQSDNSLFMPSDVMSLDDTLRMINSSPVMTPPSSPKKRKSPCKSPQKAKDRPNYLEKAIMRDTGVTEQQIKDNIGDPLPSDPKNYRCLWAGCSHVAARKENIRAHVQTHLGDRPYECPECEAHFVRPHDFTRHYTTHVDSRDFKCPDCPQAFNRADALQRHRDRDFCNGVMPPGSPTKVKRVFETMDRKKDVAGRRQKKQAIRKKVAKRQDTADSGDDFWSSSAESPGYFSSEADSPEMIVDSISGICMTGSASRQCQTPYQTQQFTSHQSAVVNDDVIEQLLSYRGDGDSSKIYGQANLSLALSPPASPEEAHAQLSLKKFSPSSSQSRVDSQETIRVKHNLTPPASRDSMLDFLNTEPSPVHDAALTISSAPSLADLSSAHSSPFALQTADDFDEYYAEYKDRADTIGANPDWFNFGDDVSTSHDYNHAAMDSSEWIKQLPLLQGTDAFSPTEADLFPSLL